MPVKKNSSGIFEREVLIGFDEEAVQAYKRIRENASLKKQLKTIKQKALEVLDRHGVREWPKDMPTGILGSSDNEELNNADAIMSNLYFHGLYEKLQKKDCEGIALYALALGRLDSQLEVRPHEEIAITGRSTRARMAGWRERRSKKVAAKHNKIILLFEEMKNHYEPHECPSDAAIQKAAAQHLKIPFNTVKSILSRARRNTTEK